MDQAQRLALAYELEQYEWDASQWLGAGEAALIVGVVEVLRTDGAPVEHLVEAVRRYLVKGWYWPAPDADTDDREDFAKAYPRLHAALVATTPDR